MFTTRPNSRLSTLRSQPQTSASVPNNAAVVALQSVLVAPIETAYANGDIDRDTYKRLYQQAAQEIRLLNHV
jgi:hypothetical protein